MIGQQRRSVKRNDPPANGHHQQPVGAVPPRDQPVHDPDPFGFAAAEEQERAEWVAATDRADRAAAWLVDGVDLIVRASAAVNADSADFAGGRRREIREAVRDLLRSDVGQILVDEIGTALRRRGSAA